MIDECTYIVIRNNVQQILFWSLTKVQCRMNFFILLWWCICCGNCAFLWFCVLLCNCCGNAALLSCLLCMCCGSVALPLPCLLGICCGCCGRMFCYWLSFCAIVVVTVFCYFCVIVVVIFLAMLYHTNTMLPWQCKSCYSYRSEITCYTVYILN